MTSESNFLNRKNDRVLWIELLRVFLCFSIVFYHVINGYKKDAVNYQQMNWPSYMNYIWITLSRYHVPSFFAISGYLYQHYTACRMENWGGGTFCTEYKLLLKKKFINLGLPYFVFSVLYIVLSGFLESDMHTYYGYESILLLCYRPVAQYWYLYSLIIMFVIAPILTLLFKRNTICILAVAIVLNIVTISLNYPFISPFRYLICFEIGASLANTKSYEGRVKKVKPLAWMLLFIGTVIVFLATCFDGTDITHPMLDFVFICCMILQLFSLAVSICHYYDIPRWVSHLAKYTLHIYLIHTWFTGALRVALRHMDNYSLVVHIIVGVVIGGGLSLLVSMIVKKIWYINCIFEPGKYILRGLH